MSLMNEGTINLIKNLVGYANKFLRIEGKDGQTHSFKFNRAQLYLHERLEEQRKKQGYVRAILIKGRQQGCTTYITARFYHKLIYTLGIKAFILSHEAKTTATIFKKVKTYQACIEQAFKNMAPKVIASNNNQLVYEPNLGGEYTIGTAGNEEVGRGFTVQLLHLSEAAFYKNPDGIEKGLVQTVGDAVPNTEIIYETTANGQNYLYEKIKQIQRDKHTDYQIIFIPWYWQEEYTVPDALIPDDFEPTEDEAALMKLYDLSPGRIIWRRRKISAFKGDVSGFKQEYPCTLEEAFEYTGSSLVRAEDVLRARAATHDSKFAPIVMGVDGARDGDRTVFVIRQGRKVLKHEIHHNMRTDTLFGLIADRIAKYNLDMVFVDPAHGIGAVDLLHASGFKDKVIPVFFNGKAIRSDVYLNKRSEVMHNVRDWFAEGADIPDDDEFAIDILSIPEAKTKTLNKLQIIGKDEIKKELGRSPDIMDALALTFSFPVHKQESFHDVRRRSIRKNDTKVSRIKTLNKKRGVSKNDRQTTRQLY